MSVLDKVKELLDKLNLDPADALVIVIAIAKLSATWPEVWAELKRVGQENEVIAPAVDQLEAVYEALTT